MVKVSFTIFFTICSFFLVTLANANNLKISAESDALYLKALPYLEKIDEVENDILNTRNQLAANETFPEQKKEQYRNKIQTLINEGMPLLRRSAEEGNPAAQYRLALILSSFESYDQTAGKVCTLLMSSFSSGFTPAGLQMFSYCFNEVETPEFRSLVDALPANETLYSKYYPQPTLMPICNSYNRSRSFTAVPLDEKSFRANIYMNFAIQMSKVNLKQEKLSYLNKAAEHGCALAIERLKLSAGS